MLWVMHGFRAGSWNHAFKLLGGVVVDAYSARRRVVTHRGRRVAAVGR